MMASTTQLPIELTDSTESILEGIGAPSMICPQIRRSHCNFYSWDKVKGKHVERPCTFTFVSEKAYQCHIFDVHNFTYHWMKKWYMIEEKRKLLEGEVRGRLPRYPPDAGSSVIERKARGDPVKMIRSLDLMFRS